MSGESYTSSSQEVACAVRVHQQAVGHQVVWQARCACAWEGPVRTHHQRHLLEGDAREHAQEGARFGDRTRGDDARPDAAGA